MPRPQIKSYQEEYLAATDVIRKVKKKRQVSEKVRALHDHAKRRGYLPSEKPNDIFGHKATIIPVKPLKKMGKVVDKIIFEMEVQNLKKYRSKNKLAIVTTTIKSGELEESYDMILEAPDGNFAKPREYIVKQGKVVPTRSWNTRLKYCLKRHGISDCLLSLLTCSGTWAAYFACVMVSCAICFIRCTGCATCRCKWWCRWLVWCCR